MDGQTPDCEDDDDGDGDDDGVDHGDDEDGDDTCWQPKLASNTNINRFIAKEGVF